MRRGAKDRCRGAVVAAVLWVTAPLWPGAVGGGGAGLSAQLLSLPESDTWAQPDSRPEPHVAVRLQEAPPVLEISPPSGWYLYAPRSTRGDALVDTRAPDPGVGLPLRLSWDGARGEIRAVADSSPETLETAAGPARVYRNAVRLRLPEPPAGSRVLHVRWALCRGDLCVPGRTRVSLTGETLPTP